MMHQQGFILYLYEWGDYNECYTKMDLYHSCTNVILKGTCTSIGTVKCLRFKLKAFIYYNKIDLVHLLVYLSF